MELKRIPKIAMLTVNPGIDRTMYFDKPLIKGEVNRATATNLNQGCKGANAVIVMARHGADATYFTYSGGPFGALYESFLEAEKIPTVSINTACGVRLNVKLSDGEGVFTECNQGGGPVSEEEKAAMLQALDTMTSPGRGNHPTARTAAEAMAASTALPPLRRMASPACVAR